MASAQPFQVGQEMFEKGVTAQLPTQLWNAHVMNRMVRASRSHLGFQVLWPWTILSGQVIYPYLPTFVSQPSRCTAATQRHLPARKSSLAVHCLYFDVQRAGGIGSLQSAVCVCVCVCSGLVAPSCGRIHQLWAAGAWGCIFWRSSRDWIGWWNGPIYEGLRWFIGYCVTSRSTRYPMFIHILKDQWRQQCWQIEADKCVHRRRWVNA